MDSRIAALSPQQRALLKRQFEQRGIAWTWTDEAVPATETAIPHGSPVAEALPLSASQQHLWVVQQLLPRSAAYHIAFTWAIKGPFDDQAFASALQALVDRHEALRTVFEAGEGAGPTQRVLPHAAVTLGHTDLRVQASPDQALKEAVHRIVHEPFDLATAPLVRVHLLHTHESAHTLVWVLHHLVADGWSRGVLMRDMDALYQAARDGRPASLPALPMQYADHVRAQAQWLQGEDSLRQADYWRRQLADLSPLDLPADRPRHKDLDHASRTLSHVLPGMGPLLRQAAARCGATPFMLLLAGFKLLLARQSGRRDLAVGIPVAGRDHPDAAGLIGFFVNTLVLRTRAPDEGRFIDWVLAVKHTVADAFDHQRLPLSKVIEAVAPIREPGRNPLFDVMFQYQGQGYGAQNAAAPAFAGLPLVQDAVALAQTKFDMTWHALERGDDLLLAVEYRTSLYDRERIDRLVVQFDLLLRAALADPSRPVGALPSLAAADLLPVLRWQRGPTPTVRDPWQGFVERFERQADETPDALAADSPTPGSALSYRALDAAAESVAVVLRARGIGAETLVGVCLFRTPSLLVVLLGVLKTGAAYLALDPTLPADRLRYMARDSRAALLVTQGSDAMDIFGAELGVDDGMPPLPPCLCLDTALQQSPPLEARASRPRTVIHPDQLAYVLYTSGSTGAPKGTLLTHAGLIHYLDWCLARYPLSAGRGAPVNSSIGFDATITGLFAPLLAGRCVTLLPEADPLPSLADAMSGGYSLVKVTPAHMNALAPLLETRPPIDPSRLPKAFVIGGEALTESHVAYWRERYPGIALINEYGPTETVVGCCVHEVTADDHGAMPIGRPIAGAAIYLLDADLNPVPAGAIGEIYIGGIGMARGYLNRRALTAERFLPDPFGVRGAAMYRTGDLARWQLDGVIDYLGRADQQLQLRGYRIEAGEVESVLTRQPGVADAVVGVRQVGPAPALVAWLTARTPGELPSADDLRQRIRAWLPAYMVPAHLIELDALPLTTNGKVDRAALPDPHTQPSSSRVAEDGNVKSDSPAQPGDSTHAATLATLLGIWQDILRQDTIGPQDNFFDLGGDSVSAMQIVARAHRSGLVITPASMFEHQTLAAQAAVARPLAASTLWHPIPAGQNQALSPAQWAFFERVREGQWPHAEHHNQSVLLDVDPAVDVTRLEAALQTLPRLHAALRLRFAPDAQGQWHQHGVASTDVPLTCHDLSGEVDPAPVLQLAMARSQQGLNLSDGPLFKAVLWRLGAGRGARLLLVAHHLVVDGVSWRLLVSDLLAAYASADEPERDKIAAATHAPEFGHWTEHLQAEGESFESEFAYWSATVPAGPGGGEPAAVAHEQDAAEYAADLDAATTARLLALGRGGDQSSLECLMVTALAQTLSQWTRQSSVTIDLESHGRALDGRDERSAPDVSGTVGWFTAVYPLRMTLPSGAPARQLDAVKTALREVPGHGLGHGVLRMQGRIPASTSTVSFNYLGRLEVPGMGFVRGLAPEAVPAQRSPAGRRQHPLEIVAMVRDDRLQFLWRHDVHQYRRAVVEQLARRTMANLQSLLALTPPSHAVPA